MARLITRMHRDPPHFLPPNTPRPLSTMVKLDTKERIRKSVVPFGTFVAAGRMDFFDAHDIICRAFIRHIWSGRSLDTFTKFEMASYRALMKAVDEAEDAMRKIEDREQLWLASVASGESSNASPVAPSGDTRAAKQPSVV